MGLSTNQIERLSLSFQIIEPNLDRFEDILYAQLFEIDPELEALFPKDFTEQRRHMGNAIKLLVKNLNILDEMGDMLAEMGARHVVYGATARHYPAIVFAMLYSFSEIMEEDWIQTLHDDWAEVLNIIAGYMIQGAKSQENRAA